MLPREKMMHFGASALTETELLALLLRTGCQGLNVMDFSHQLLDQFAGLNGLLTTEHKELISIKGLGPAKATQLSAILEICRRVLSQKLAKSDIITSPDSTRKYLQLHFQGLEREEFVCLPVPGYPASHHRFRNTFSRNIKLGNGSPSGGS
ncbi:MAG: UPF0758 domain-containing protein [Endozoicomonas sp.]